MIALEKDRDNLRGLKWGNLWIKSERFIKKQSEKKEQENQKIREEELTSFIASQPAPFWPEGFS